VEGLDIRKLRVRSLSAEDLESIIEIDEKVLGERRPEYWRQKVQASTAHPAKSLVAEIEGKVIGFILGTVSGWEFGVPSSFGWVLSFFKKMGFTRGELINLEYQIRK